MNKITAKTRKIKSEYSIQTFTSCDMHDELTKALTEQIRKEIDNEILFSLGIFEHLFWELV